MLPKAMAEQNTVLTLLQYVYDNLDHTLAFRGPCGRGVCGSCTMRINGQPGLSCLRKGDENITLEPLAKLPVIRDLVVDMQTRKKRS